MSATITDEQSAARDLVRQWAAGAGASAAVRDIEQGRRDAWQQPYRGLAGLGLFGVAVPEAAGAPEIRSGICAQWSPRRPGP